MAKQDVTLKDIAQAVGKSTATVSKALHDHDDIASETRAYIRQVAAELGYRPNVLARRLQKRRTESLGLVLPVLSSRRADPFFVELLAGITDQAAEQGFDVLVSTRRPGQEEYLAYERLVKQQLVDGIILTQPRRVDWRLDFLIAQAMPFVVAGPVPEDRVIPGVWVDVAAGINQAVAHLAEQGRRRLALVPPPAELLLNQLHRQAFAAAVAGYAGLEGQCTVEPEQATSLDGYRVAQMLLARDDLPDAIIAGHDLLALGALAAAQDQGFEPGTDVAIVGFGDSLMAEHAHPPLTAVHQPTYSIGQQVCDRLIQQINQHPVQGMQTIEPWLVVRQSSALALWV